MPGEKDIAEEEPARRRTARQWLLAVAGAAVITAGCASERRPASPIRYPPGEWLELPGSLSQLQGVEIDLASGTGGNVWLAYSSGGKVHVYRRDLSGWKEAEEAGPGVHPKFASVGGDVSLIASTGVEVLEYRQRGEEWTARSILKAPNQTVVALDLAELEDRAVVIAAVRSGFAPDGGTHLRLLSWQLTEGGAGDPAVVAEFQAFNGQTAIRVAAESNRLWLAWAQNELKQSGNSKISAARIFVSSSDDGGMTWREPEEAPLGTAGHIQALMPNSLELAVRAGGIELLFREGACYRTMRTGSTWSPVQKILDYPPGATTGRTMALAGTEPWLIWIDNRLEKGARHPWWNPTGGVPWSDDYPGWGISTVFAQRLDELVLDSGNAAPQLLSSADGFAAAVAAAHTREGLIAAWAGQRKVKKAAANSSETVARLFSRFFE